MTATATSYSPFGPFRLHSINVTSVANPNVGDFSLWADPLTGAAFTLVLYGAGDSVGQGDTFGLAGGTGGNSAATLTTTGNDRNIFNGIGDAYNTYTGTVGAGGTLTVSVTTNGTSEYGPLDGLQLEEVGVPEPATWLGGALLLGGIGVNLRRRLHRA